ncbi:MAG: amidohydrolase [Actinomycetota bacterium]|nr:amidohydrolase [Actinomycetota bacterium]
MAARIAASALIAALSVAMVAAGRGGAGPEGHAAAAAAKGSADRVLFNGRIYTVGGPAKWASAIAVDGRRIAYVGDDAEAKRLAGPGAERINLKGRMVMPGLVDGHSHPLDGGALLDACSLDFAKLTIAEFQKSIQRCIDNDRTKEPDSWLEVEGWNAEETKPPGTVIRKQALDALDTQRPIVVHNADGHKSLANSRALELAGITGSTPDPPGGVIEKAGGEATGLLFESAQALVNRLVPKDSFSDRLRWARLANEALSESGVTSTLDVGGGRHLEVFEALREQGDLTVRTQVAAVLKAGHVQRLGSTLDRLGRLRREFDHDLLRAGVVKVFADGVLEAPAQTASLLEPYLEKARPTKQRGLRLVKPEAFERLVTSADRRGFQVHVHAIGDRAVRDSLDAVEAARAANRVSGWGNRHTITHLQLIDPAEIPRFAQLRVIASMQMQWFQLDGFTVDAVKPFIGVERFAGMYPAGSLVRSGAKLAAGSDWPVDPLFPFYAIERAVTRRADGFYGYDKGVLNPAERISLEQSIEAYTLGASFQMRQDHRTGSLEAGKLADLIVLNRNLFKVPADRIYGTKVLLTLLGGRVVHRAGSF